MKVFSEQKILGKNANGNNVSLCSVIVDTFADLPAQDVYIVSDNIQISMGSKGYCIDTGKMYMLNSAGQWIEQGGMICYF